MSGASKKYQSKPVGKKIADDETVQLTEDLFGYLYNDTGERKTIRRFTWSNQNRIHVQVINYGARIVSIKYPDKNGEIDDIVLGFDDLAGYMYYKKYYFGATIGRMSHIVNNSSFKIGNKEYFLKPNTDEGHHLNGGSEGFDQKVWKTFIQGKQVIMSHMSPSGDQGYPGHLLVRVIFELSETNEFKIQMEAFASEPTIINMTNLTYLNLAGHHAGPDAIYRHVITVNGNCYTKHDNDGNCTGEILNVAHMDIDIQGPTLLGTIMGIFPKDGFNQNFCLNRAIRQDSIYVGRLLHPPSGRLIEIYTNQYGVQLDTANHFGYGQVLSLAEIMQAMPIEPSVTKVPDDSSLIILDYLHDKLLSKLQEEKESHYAGFREFIRLLQSTAQKTAQLRSSLLPSSQISSGSTPRNSNVARYSKTSMVATRTALLDNELSNFQCTPKQLNYLKTLQDILNREDFDESAHWLQDVIDKLIFYETKNPKTLELEPIASRAQIKRFSQQSFKTAVSGVTNKSDTGLENVRSDSSFSDKISIIVDKASIDKLSIIDKAILEKTVAEKQPTTSIVSDKDIQKLDGAERVQRISVYPEDDTIEKAPPVEKKPPLKMPKVSLRKNVFPSYYKCSEIIGKDRKQYKRHGGIALRTQNYPNCANIEHFPSCVLYPGQQYVHTIVYKFSIRSGNPNKWVKRNLFEMKQLEHKMED